jgi:chaperone required for assembly of F1-ATPase
MAALTSQIRPVEVNVSVHVIIKERRENVLKFELLELDDEEQDALDEALEDALAVAQGVLDSLIDDDQTPETVEEFMTVISSQQDRIAVLKTLQQRFKGE